MLSVENEAIFAICMKTGWKLKSFFFDGSNWCDSRLRCGVGALYYGREFWLECPRWL